MHEVDGLIGSVEIDDVEVFFVGHRVLIEVESEYELAISAAADLPAVQLGSLVFEADFCE